MGLLLVNIKYYFYDSFIVELDGKFVPMIKSHEYIDDKTNTKYYVYMNILDETYSIEFEELNGESISCFLFDSEVHGFLHKELDEKEMLNIVARAIKELNTLKKNNKEKTKIFNYLP